MKDFLRGLYYYSLNNFFLKIPFWWIRKKILKLFGYKIHDSAFVHVGCVVFGKGYRLEVGKNTTINADCVLDARSKLKIGSGCSISRGVTFITQSHDYNSENFALIDGPVTIGNYVWIGSNAIILPNVKIANNCVIGAGSVVTKDCGVSGVYVGNPAKMIKRIDSSFVTGTRFAPWFGYLN